MLGLDIIGEVAGDCFVNTVPDYPTRAECCKTGAVDGIKPLQLPAAGGPASP